MRIQEERMETYFKKEKFDGHVHWPLPTSKLSFNELLTIRVNMVPSDSCINMGHVNKDLAILHEGTGLQQFTSRTETGWKKEEAIDRMTIEEGDNTGRAIDEGTRTRNMEENPFRAIAMISLIPKKPNPETIKKSQQTTAKKLDRTNQSIKVQPQNLKNKQKRKQKAPTK